MPQQRDDWNYRRCGLFISAYLMLLLLDVDSTVAFPTVQLSSRTNNRCFNSCKSIPFGDEYPSYYDRSGVGVTQQFPWKSRRQLSLALRAKSDDQDEFQRSLLAAKIANDIKGTVVKEENHRQERVEKQIDREKEKLQSAVKEVQEAAQNVTLSAKNLGGAVISNSTEVKDAVVDVSQSAKSLGGAVITKGLGIVTRFLTTLLATHAFRLVVFTIYLFHYYFLFIVCRWSPLQEFCHLILLFDRRKEGYTFYSTYPSIGLF